MSRDRSGGSEMGLFETPSEGSDVDDEDDDGGNVVVIG